MLGNNLAQFRASITAVDTLNPLPELFTIDRLIRFAQVDQRTSLRPIASRFGNLRFRWVKQRVQTESAGESNQNEQRSRDNKNNWPMPSSTSCSLDVNRAIRVATRADRPLDRLSHRHDHSIIRRQCPGEHRQINARLFGQRFVKQSDRRTHRFGKRSAIMTATQMPLDQIVVQVVLGKRAGSQSLEDLIAIDRVID